MKLYQTATAHDFEQIQQFQFTFDSFHPGAARKIPKQPSGVKKDPQLYLKQQRALREFLEKRKQASKMGDRYLKPVLFKQASAASKGRHASSSSGAAESGLTTRKSDQTLFKLDRQRPMTK
jgi:hypothetical protein